jgi:hypothetical protein
VEKRRPLRRQPNDHNFGALERVCIPSLDVYCGFTSEAKAPALAATTETPQDLALRKQEEHAVRTRLGRVGEDFSSFHGRQVDWE